jgi:hypothetical protein
MAPNFGAACGVARFAYSGEAALCFSRPTQPVYNLTITSKDYEKQNREMNLTVCASGDRPEGI